VTIPDSFGALGASRSSGSAAPSSPPQAVPPVREPALWTMLSKAERAFFDVPTLEGPLGYGPGGAPTEPTPALGQTIDIRA